MTTPLNTLPPVRENLLLSGITIGLMGISIVTLPLQTTLSWSWLAFGALILIWSE